MLIRAGMGTSVSISEAEIIKEKQGPGDRHPEPGAVGEDTNQSEKDKQEKCKNQLPYSGNEGEGNGRQLLTAPPSWALWIPHKVWAQKYQVYWSLSI